MSMNRNCSTIIAKNFIKTIGFYEDHFDFIPVEETKDIVVMQRKGHEEICLRIFDANQIDKKNQTPNEDDNTILYYPVDDVDAAYDAYYWDGLSIIEDDRNDRNEKNRKSFYVEDPNGLYINVSKFAGK